MAYYVILKFFSPGATTVQAALEFMTPGGLLSPFKIASSFLFSIAFRGAFKNVLGDFVR